MATTTIPWGDGSGDNIYLDYPAASGDQTVAVSSDANTGAARTKVVTFSASGVTPVTLTVEQAAGAGDTGYLIHGSPTIADGIASLNAAGFIYCNKQFDPTGHSFTFEMEYMLNSAKNGRDLFGTCDASGNRIWSICVQTTSGDSNRRYFLNLSSNNSSFNVATQKCRGMTPAANTWKRQQLICTYSGGKYTYYVNYPDDGSSTATYSTTTAVYQPFYPSFGGGVGSTPMDGKIKLSSLKIYVDGSLWWSAI